MYVTGSAKLLAINGNTTAFNFNFNYAVDPLTTADEANCSACEHEKVFIIPGSHYENLVERGDTVQVEYDIEDATGNAIKGIGLFTIE